MESNELEKIINNWMEKSLAKAECPKKEDIEKIYSIIKLEISYLIYEKFKEVKEERFFENIFSIILDAYQKNKDIPRLEFVISIKKSLEKIEKPKITDYVEILFERNIKENLKGRELAESYQ